MRAKEKNKPTNKLAVESRKRNMLCGIAAMLCLATMALSCNNQGENPDSSGTHGTQSAQEQTSLGNSSVDSVVIDNENVLNNVANDAIAAAATKYKEEVITKVESQTSLTSKDFQNSKRKALLIGVGNYRNYTKHKGWNEDTGWEDLSSLNDIALLQELLIALEFKVVTITDEAATHAEIINALNLLAAKGCCHPGDTLIVHFSGHGQPMIDIVGDESDNMTETFIPIDAQRIATKEYDMAQNHLKDDEIYEYIVKITNKIGTNGVLLVSLDACHSGDGTLAETNVDKNRIIRSSGDTFHSDKLNKMAKLYDKTKAKKPKYSSHFYALSACKSDEPNYEYKDEAGALGVKDREYGSLSFALCRELANLKKGEKIDFDKLTNAVINHKENNPPLWDCQTPVKETNESDHLH